MLDGAYAKAGWAQRSYRGSPPEHGSAVVGVAGKDGDRAFPRRLGFALVALEGLLLLPQDVLLALPHQGVQVLQILPGGPRARERALGRCRPGAGNERQDGDVGL